MMRNEWNSPMTSAQYDFAIARIKELQNPAFQPLGLALAWELNELMTQVAQYEEEHDREAQEEYEFMLRFEDAFLASQDR